MAGLALASRVQLGCDFHANSSRKGGLLGVIGVFLGLVGIILWIEYTGESMKPCIRCVTRSR